MSKRITLGITLGDPSGIGPEVVAKAINNGNFKNITPLIIGSHDVFRNAISNNNISMEVIHLNDISKLSKNPRENTIQILDSKNPKISQKIRKNPKKAQKIEKKSRGQYSRYLKYSNDN